MGAPNSPQQDSPVGARISKLDDSIVQKIAAGEVIQRPCNAVKELVENSIDAGATHIAIMMQEGGLKLIQIQDNGQGIHNADLPLLCERYATSKLSQYEDLYSMGTFGFRGEALASISHVSRLSVVTKTKNLPYAFKASYIDGKLCSDPTPCAGNQGTVLVVQDLFYNLPLRSKMVTNSNEEYAKTVEIVQKYSVQYAGKIEFSCRKVGATNSTADLQTTHSQSTLDIIKLIFGSSVSQLLLPLNDHNDALGLVVNGYVSAPTFHQKKSTFILFINNRLVDCSRLKKAVLAFYSEILPKGTLPWIFISLAITPNRLDINVHPTKREVIFLEEEETINHVLLAINSSVTNGGLIMKPTTIPIISTQPLSTSKEITAEQQKTLVDETLSIASQVHCPTSLSSLSPPPLSAVASQKRQSNSTTSSTFTRLYPFQQIHTDPKMRKLDAFTCIESFKRTNSSPKPTTKMQDSSQSTQLQSNVNFDDSNLSNGTEQPLPPKYLEARSQISNQIKANGHKDLISTLKNCILVGIIDERFLLAQYQARLLLIDYVQVMEELFLHRAILAELNCDKLNLNDAVAISTLIQARSQSQALGPDIDNTELANEVESILCEHLLELASCGIQIDGIERKLLSIPKLIEGIEEFNQEIIGQFLLNLAVNVNFDSAPNLEQLIAEICHELAKLYCRMVSEHPKRHLYIEHFVLPAIRGMDNLPNGILCSTHFSSKLARSSVMHQLTTTHDLYKIFERC